MRFHTLDERLVELEREVNKDSQHLRRDTIEFAGISADIPDDKIEDECLGILKAAEVKIGNKFPAAKDVHAAHRKGRKGIVILKFVNRKFAVQALLNRYKLRELDDYSDIFINQSLCPEYSYLNFAVRKAKRNNEISYYKLKNGVSLIQKETDSPFVEKETDSPFVEKETDSPFVEKETDSPFVEKETDNPFVEKETDSPFVEKETDSPFVEKETDSPFVEKETDNPFVEKETDSPFVEKETDSPFVEKETDSPFL